METKLTIFKNRKEAFKNAVEDLNDNRDERDKVKIINEQEDEEFINIILMHAYKSDLFYLGIYFNQRLTV